MPRQPRATRSGIKMELEIEVQTGRQVGAGTDASVSMTIVGDDTPAGTLIQLTEKELLRTQGKP